MPEVGCLSPHVVRDLAAGRGNALTLLRRRQTVPLAAANLCASLIGSDDPTVPVEAAIAAAPALLG